jgi:hypothetical protein
MPSDAMAAPAPTPGYPLRFDVQYPDHLSRLLNNPFLGWIKWILAIPHLIILYVLNLVLYVFTVIAFFAILFTRQYPEGLWRFSVNVLRWQANVYAYIFQLRDEYPPFSWDAGKYPVTFEVDYVMPMGRWAPFFKLWPFPILLIPHYIALILIFIVAIVLWLIGSFAILFTGKMPKGIFDFLVGTGRWAHRVTAYQYLLTDKYPPFSMK